MPSSSHNLNRSHGFALKQAANWQCQSCGRLCRRHKEALDDFAIRIGDEVDTIAAHPRRWILHVTKLYTHSTRVANKVAEKKGAKPSVVVLCGSCHRSYHNYQRWQRRHQRQEQLGQLTLRDIRLPLAGLQLSLNDWGAPYEIVNPLSSGRRAKSSKRL
ncbi:MAG: hypothetical protein F6K31_43935 [Symploca sp. SIO2G7]|nr:hypothetical protein [Symploca sp. SIO2G7]